MSFRYLLPAATKLWPRLCFYSCLWFCPQCGEGCLPQCMLGYHPSEQTPLPEQTPPLEQTPPGANTPPEQTVPGADTPQSRPSPQSRHPPRSRHPPPPNKADSSIRSMSGRYASYWNAFLLCFVFTRLIITEGQTNRPLICFFCHYSVHNVWGFKLLAWRPVNPLWIVCVK